MATTIQISDSTKQLLELLKEQEEASSYDQVLQKLLRQHTKVPKSMFGTMKDIKWKKSDRMDFHEY